MAATAPNKSPALWVAGGLVLVSIDLRTEYLDLLPDPAGWLMVANGARILSLRLAAGTAAATALVSLALVHLPSRFVQIDPLTGRPVERTGTLTERTDGGGVRDLYKGITGQDLAPYPEQLRFDDMSGWRLAAAVVAPAAGGLGLWLLLRGLQRRAGAHGRPTTARQLLVLRWLVVLVWTIPQLVVMAVLAIRDSGRVDPVWNGSLAYVTLAGVVVLATLAVLLCLEHRRAWATPEGLAHPSRWDLGAISHRAARGSGRDGAGNGSEATVDGGGRAGADGRRRRPWRSLGGASQ